MTHKTFRITGRVVDQTGQGVEGLRVEAWDKDFKFHDLVGSEDTGSEGFFEMEFEESYFKEIFARRPDLFFKIFREDELIPGAEFEVEVQLPTGKIMKGSGDKVFCKVASGTTKVTIKLQIPAGSQIFKVHGRVLEPDGRPVVGAKVIAFDIGMQNVEVELGEEGITDEAGRYEITYKAELFLKANKKRPDLDVRAYNQQGDKIAWLVKPPIYNAKQVVTVYLIVGGEAYKGPSEYQQIMDTISPLLQDLELSELTDEDVDFLAGKTGTSSEQIVYLVLASRYAKKTELPPELFYGLFRQNLSTSLPALLAQSADIVRQAMEAAVNANIVPVTVSFEQVWERFQELAVDHAFEPFDPVPEGKATLGELLETVEISVDQQRQFLTLYVRHEGSIEEFWQGLEETSLQPYVSDLQFALQLGVLTQNNIPLVQHLKDSSDSLKVLASLNLEEWEDKAATYGIPPDVPGKDQEAKVENYAHTILRMVEDAFPTAVIIHKINQDEEIPGKADLLQFFVNNSEFEFGSMPIDQYLNENTSALAGIDDQTGLIRQLKSLDRLFRICPRFDRYEAMKVLMENGFNSAQSIAMMGQRSFATQYAEKLGNYWKAKAIYANASQMAAMTMALNARLNPVFNQIGMRVLADQEKILENIPDWKTLFPGSFNLCDCEHCKSVLSPSAYLVDLLAFLRNHMLKKKHISGPLYDVNSALGVLSDRRRDIEHINLSCENTNTPVPYVDLVNEILENAVSYNAEYYQTTGTADELSANPEHFNKSAYDKLAEEIYPWNLPFDLWTEEARSYLGHLGVPYYRLLEVFHRKGDEPQPADYAITGEYLGQTPLERQIIAGTTSFNEWDFWNLEQEETIPDPADATKTISVTWIELLGNLPVFLERSGLSFREVEELLDTIFVNPNRFNASATSPPDIHVRFPDVFCNIDEADIMNLEDTALSKIYRFTRLLRKLGWSAIELDRAIDILNADDIDDPLLLKLSHIQRIHTDLKIPLIKLMSFWGPIDTQNYNDTTISLYDELFLNKAVLNPEDQIFLLNDDRNELQDNTQKISYHVAGVLSAFKMSDSKLSLLIGLELLFTLDWTAEIQESLSNGEKPTELMQRFKESGIALSESASVSTIEENTWLITDADQKYTISKRDVKLYIYAKETGVVADLLNLNNLSKLYRIVTLSRGVKLSIKDFLSVKQLTGLEPFDPSFPEVTLMFIEKVRWLQASGFSIGELDYMLRHVYKEGEGIAPTEDQLTEILREIGDGLLKISNENAYVTDPTGDLIRTKLALLMSADELDQAMAIISGTFHFSFSSELNYHFEDPNVSKELRLVFEENGIKLTNEARLFLKEPNRAWNIVDRDEENNRLTYLISKKISITNIDYYCVNGNIPDGWKDFIDKYFSEFLNNEEIEEAKAKLVFWTSNFFIDEIAERHEYMIRLILDCLRRTQSEHFLIEKLAGMFDLELSSAEDLLTQRINFVLDSQPVFFTDFLDKFVESDGRINVSEFSGRFKHYVVLIQKIALITGKLGVTTEELPLLFQKAPDGWLDLNELPLSASENAPILFASWEKLVDLFHFRDDLLPGKPNLVELFNSESLEKLLQVLSKRTGWTLEDVEYLTNKYGFALSDFRQVEALTTLKRSFGLIKRLGGSAEDVWEWSRISSDSDYADLVDASFQKARNIKQAVKAKYDDTKWLTVAKPLRDNLREKQRSALVSYLIAHYAFRDKTFKDSNDLYAHFLIDPEMDPCMMTSRLKLATSTIQLFVQRCLMNLEEWKIPNATIAQEWGSQWKWMKNYRVWEANRKVFLYPENWIEPELRDDKSPFFKDLENELLQNEITAENVEKGFLNYLEKLDAVARLEICGMYHEVEKEAPDGIGKNAIDTLHVFGRTRGMPHIYYYRRRIATDGKTMYWTPWERVDLDIEGDHLIPVVWNRRLYLFWPIFIEKAEKGGKQGEEPPKYWQIQMAWSEYKNGKWLPKNISNEMIDIAKVFPAFLDLYSLPKNKFFFETRINSYDLVIDCNIVARFWGGNYAFVIASFRITDCFSRIIINYHIYSKDDLPTKKIDFPIGSYVKSMIFEELPGEHILALSPDIVFLYETPGTYNILHPHKAPYLFSQSYFFYQDNTKTFFVTPFNFNRVGTGAYYPPEIDMYDPNTPELEWNDPHKVQPEQIDMILPGYYNFITVYERWEKMIPPTIDIDPPIVDETFPVGTYYDETIEHGPDYGFYSTRARTETRIIPKSMDSSLLSRHTSMAMTYYTLAKSISEKGYLLETFYHPYVCEFVKHLNREGIEGLLQRHVQMMENYELLLFSVGLEFQSDLDNGILSIELEKNFNSHDIQIWKPHYIVSIIETGMSWLITNYTVPWGGTYKVKKEESRLNIYQSLFDNEYKPNLCLVKKPYPYEDVDFEPHGAYSLYNWEIFFHIPLMIAVRLSTNQRFAEAQKWFHYIFDPTDTSTHDIPQKYWKFRPFFEAAAEQPPQTLVDLLTKEQEELKIQVKEWMENPFKPHLIARMRIMAYQKTVVMKYIDNLIVWGDQLFRRDTIESINEATQLYILAAEILGKRPEDIPPHTEPPVKTFNDLIEGGELDAFSNRMVEEENYLSSPKSAASMTMAGDDMQMFGPSYYLCSPAAAYDGQEDKELLYFCIPKNQKLLSYWDTVTDRLFKIRHCMNIEGVVRQLPLFEPPIDPGLLVRAAAAGVDISSALSDLNAPLPHYRFQFMLQKAIEFCADVRSLGASLLSALEKKDAEKMALLRSEHEAQLLKAIRQIKKQQIDEAKETLDGLKKTKEVTEFRYQYYNSREYMNLNEQLYLDKLGEAHDWQMHAQRSEVAAAIAHLLPTLDFGTAGWASSPLVKLGSGGLNVGSALQATAGVMRALASIENHKATRASIKGGYDRRFDDWNFQSESASKELKQIDKQILAAEIRKAIAEKDLENHDIQTENAEEVNTFMKDKFTDQELYNWMVSQISTIYFQSYQMAYDIAKRAEKAFQHELGDYDATFIKFGYWDSLKKGLLSGEKLHYDLKRMETGYLEKNKREYEITKHISLAMLDPVDLIKLKETGECFVNIPEAIFDLDYPGHYMRRIKSVSLTIPCVTGPYTSLNCTLTLLKNSVRIDSSATGEYARDENGDDPRFRDNIGAIQSIATSHGQNDSGMFELNFRDERYLPFEGAGAISSTMTLFLTSSCTSGTPPGKAARH
jgi:hypothetical protein